MSQSLVLLLSLFAAAASQNSSKQEGGVQSPKFTAEVLFVGEGSGDMPIWHFTAVNDEGELVGVSRNDLDHAVILAQGGKAGYSENLDWMATRWRLGRDAELRSNALIFPGFSESHVVGINSEGVMVGFAEKEDLIGDAFRVLAFLHAENGTITDISALSSMRNCWPKAINDRGDVVGDASNDPGPFSWSARYHTSAFHWSPSGEFRVLPAPQGATNIKAVALSKDGLIAGECESANYSGRRVVVWQGNEVLELPEVGGHAYCRAGDINDRGDIVGYSMESPCDSGGETRPLLWTRDHYGTFRGRDLGFEGTAIGINSQGWVVGTRTDCAGGQRCAALYLREGRWSDKGIALDLNDLVLPTEDWIAGKLRLVEALDLTDTGMILCRAWKRGANWAYVLLNKV